MSFFVSDSIKDKIVLEEQGKSVDKKTLSTFSILFFDHESEYVARLKSITYEKSNEYVAIFESNLEMFERIFFNKVSAKEIFIGNEKKHVSQFSFLEAHSTENYYLIKVTINVRD